MRPSGFTRRFILLIILLYFFRIRRSPVSSYDLLRAVLFLLRLIKDLGDKKAGKRCRRNYLTDDSARTEGRRAEGVRKDTGRSPRGSRRDLIRSRFLYAHCKTVRRRRVDVVTPGYP